MSVCIEAQVICIELYMHFLPYPEYTSDVKHIGLPESILKPGKNASSSAEKHFLKSLIFLNFNSKFTKVIH